MQTVTFFSSARPTIFLSAMTQFSMPASSGIPFRFPENVITFEPNPQWREIAEQNIGAINARAQLIQGAFEEQLMKLDMPPQSIDILSVDAIHTPAAVSGQLAAAQPFLSPDAIVLIDDIKFSPEMYRYWRELASAPDIAVSFEIESRVGAFIRHAHS